MEEYLREGDTVVVWRLDRLGRSLKDLIAQITEFEKRGIGFHSITESIDTTTAGGKKALNMRFCLLVYCNVTNYLSVVYRGIAVIIVITVRLMR